MIDFDFRKNGVDYLLVNSTNKYLLEYVPIEENACSKITGFTGDVGDALISSNGKIYLFVDSRFHIQADNEVKDNVEVVKLQLGEKFDDAIISKINGGKLGINPETISQARYERLSRDVEVKFIEINTKCRYGNFEKIDSDKLEKIEGNYLITKSEELSYLLGIRSFSFNYSTKVDGKLIIKDNEPILFTDYVGEAARPLREFDDYISKIDEPIYVDKTSINAKDYGIIKNPISKESPVKKLKSIKSNEEINHMEYCFSMTDKAVCATRDWIYKTDNISEYDIKEELENNFKKYSAKSLSFASIVAINENSALAHYNKTDKIKLLKDGDLVLIDCGAYYDKGLATDITRVFVKGEPSEKQKTVYTIVLKSFLNCYNYLITDKTNGYEIDKLAHDIFNQNQIEGFAFSHGLGHGIGIGVHECPPNLSKNEIAKTVLREGMCFTIEPGLYKENEFGIRLENTCHLQKGKIVSFTKMCFEKKMIKMDLLSETEKEILKQFEVC